MDALPSVSISTGGYDRKKGFRYLWGLLKNSEPEQLGDHLRLGLEQELFNVDRALAFPLVGSLDAGLSNLPHAHPKWQGQSRDQRLLTWFQTVSELGGDPLRALNLLHHDRFGSAMARLMKMRAHKCLDWWREHGIERYLQQFPEGDGRRLNLATIAFLHGQVHCLDLALQKGDTLEHPDKLWPAIWSKTGVGVADSLLKRLMRPHIPPPPGVMSWWAGAGVNKKNIDSVIKSGARLIHAGADPNEAARRAMPPLAVAVRRANSPSVSRVVAFLLEHGADPVAPFHIHLGGEQIRTCALEVALDTLIKTSPASHLRVVARDNFMKMARLAPVGAIREIYPLERQTELLEKVRAGEDKAYAAEKAAVLEGVWLTTLVDTTQVQGRSRPRI